MAETDEPKSNFEASYRLPLLCPVKTYRIRSRGDNKHQDDLRNFSSFFSRKYEHNNPFHAGIASSGADISRINHDVNAVNGLLLLDEPSSSDLFFFC